MAGISLSFLAKNFEALFVIPWLIKDKHNLFTGWI